MPHLKITREENPHTINGVLKPELVVREKGCPPEALRQEREVGVGKTLLADRYFCMTVQHADDLYCACAAMPILGKR